MSEHIKGYVRAEIIGRRSLGRREQIRVRVIADEADGVEFWTNEGSFITVQENGKCGNCTCGKEKKND